MQMIARGYLAYELTSSPFLLGVVSSGFAVPLLGLSLFGGAFADRFERKYIIQFGQGMAAVLSIVIGVAIHLDVVAWYHLWIASIVQGSLFAFLMPARQAIIPQLVGQERLSNAMALNAAAMSAMTLAAPALAGWAYAYLGPYNVYYIISGLAIIAFLLSGLLPKTGTGSGRRPAPMLGDILEGLVYIRQSPLVLILLLMGLATSLLAMPFRFLMPLFVVDVYRMGPEAMGLLVTIMGGGSLVGSLFIASLGKSGRGMLLIIGSFMSGIALLFIALIPIYLVAAGLMVLLGLGDAGRRTLNQSLINGRGGGQVSRACNERVHAELRADAAGSSACWHVGRILWWSGSGGHTRGAAAGRDHADTGYAEAPAGDALDAYLQVSVCRCTTKGPETIFEGNTYVSKSS